MTDFRIGILGCGWLGLPLATNFVARDYLVKGATTSPQKLGLLAEKGIKPYQIKLSESHINGDISGFLVDIDILVINIPPGLRRNPEANYPKKLMLLCDEIKKSEVKNIIFISSTSVYGEQGGEITEATPPKPKTASAVQLLKAEELFGELKQNTTLLRFGGLIGPNRHPVYQLSGRTGLKNGDDLVNLIHLNDCIYMINTIIEEGYWGEIFNGVYPFHPTKKEYYTSEALKNNIDLPEYYDYFNKSVKKLITNKAFNSKNHFLQTPITSSFTTKK